MVLAEKPLISEETDLLEPTLLDELISHIGTLASVYHRPPHTFVEGRFFSKRNILPRSSVDRTESTPNAASPANQPSQSVVISNMGGQLLGDFDDFPGMMSNVGQIQQAPAQSTIPNLLDNDLESIMDIDPMVNAGPASLVNTTTSAPANRDSLDDLFGDLTVGTNASTLFYSSNQTLALPKEVRIVRSK